MKLRYIFLMIFFMFNSIDILAVSVLINTDEETPKEEKKEEKKVELPSPAKLAINVINMTSRKYTTTVIASVKKNDGFVMAQSNIDPQGKITMATLLAPSNSSFIFNEAEVIILKDDGNMDIKCNLAKKDDEAKDEDLEAKKTIDMYIYLPPDQDLPHCVIKYDSI